MILLKSKLSARQTRTVIRDNITTVINEQQIKRTQEVCTRQLFKKCSMPLRHCCCIISYDQRRRNIFYFEGANFEIKDFHHDSPSLTDRKLRF